MSLLTKDVIQLFLDEIVGELGRGNRLEFREFGVFEIKERAARKGRNPRTGDTIDIAASKSVSFKPAPTFKEEL